MIFPVSKRVWPPLLQTNGKMPGLGRLSPFTQFARDAGIVDEDLDVVRDLLDVVDKPLDALKFGRH